MKKEMIIQKLRERGCRVTEQRRMLLDIILEGECSCCKEIYYKASGRAGRVSPATVYRMVGVLEEIGVISRKNMYKLIEDGVPERGELCAVEFDDGTIVRFSAEKWVQIVRAGLKACGYLGNRRLRSVKMGDADLLRGTDGKQKNGESGPY